MVQNMITEEETEKLEKVFQQLDANKDGKLSYHELLQGYSQYLSKDMAKEEVDRVFELVDMDHCNEIHFSEFVTATANRTNLLQDGKLEEAFSYYDKDNSGSISVEEIRNVLGGGQKISDEVWRQVVTEVDEDGDGEVSLEEFKAMMKKLLK